MGILADGLKHYLATTPREQAIAEWESLAYLDNVGPSIDYFIEQTETNFMKNSELKNISKAANRYALKMLGQEQFENNPDAVKAISEDFMSGAKWAIKTKEGSTFTGMIKDAMEKNKVLISVYNNASGFLWSMMMCPGGTDLGGSYQVDRPNTNDAGSFDSWNEAAQDALDLLGDYTLDQFEATRNEHRCSWSEFVDHLGKLEAKKKNTEKDIRD